MKVYAVTDIGVVRPLNEDSYYLPRSGEPFCAVADGMGGHNAGEVASALAVETFARCMRDSESFNGTAISEAVVRANEVIYRESKRDDRKSGMGTTFTGLCEDGTNMHIAHVGDSRAYLLRNDEIMRVTKDHTLVEEMVMQGVITSKEAKVHPQRNIITRALGTQRHVDVDLIQLDIRDTDVIFMCSDGLSNYVEEKEILEITRTDQSWEERLHTLVQKALSNGSTDNITAMFVTFEEDHR